MNSWKNFMVRAAFCQEVMVLFAKTMAELRIKPEEVFDWLNSQNGRAATEEAFGYLGQVFRSYIHRTGLERIRNDVVEMIARANIPALEEPFAVSENFKLVADGGICSKICDDFRHLVLNKMVEEQPMPASTICCHRLMGNTCDYRVKTALGPGREHPLPDVGTYGATEGRRVGISRSDGGQYFLC